MESDNICAICLRTNRKLKNVATVLAAYHNKITNDSLQLTNALYCSECEFLLRKTYNFYQKCLTAAEILKTWLATTETQESKSTPVSMLYTKLPQTNLAMWTAQNSKVFCYKYITPENDDAPIVIDDTNLDEDTPNECPEIQNTPPQNKDSKDTKNIFQKDNTIPSAEFSEPTVSIKKEKTKKSNDSKTNKESYIELVPDINDILKKKHKRNTKSKLKHETKLAEVKLVNEVKSDESSEDEIIYLKKNNKDVKIDDGNDYLDDASLNSGDDCDEYVPPKKTKKKKIIDQHKEKEDESEEYLSEEDLDEDLISVKERIKSAKFNTTLDKFIAVQKNVDSKIRKISRNLDLICENWEMTSLTDIECRNIPKNEIVAFLRSFLTDREVAKKIRPGRSEHLRKMPLKNKFANMNSNLDLINEACANVLEDHNEGIVAPKLRVKQELTQRLEKWGELKANDGTVFDIDLIMTCLDMAPRGVVRRLLKYLRDNRNSKRLSPGIIQYFKLIQNKQQLEKYKSVFNIEYMKSEREAREEFEQRKTYECYINAEHKCDVCYQTFRYEGMLEYHKKYHTESKGPMRCNMCKINFNSRRRHQTHKLSHEIVYKCKLCPLVTYYIKSMQNHYEQHKGTVYKCDKCDMTYKSKSVYVAHQTRAHLRDGHVCTICGGVFFSAAGLRTHNYRKHSDETPPEPSGNEVKCESCNLTFASPQAYHKHQLKLHRANAARPYMRRRLIPRKKPIMTCKVCNKVGHSYGWMVLHFNSEHPTMDITAAYADKRTNLCEVCGKGFTTKQTLRKHISFHHSGVTFPCPKCGKRFPSPDSLKNHRYIHGPPRFCCDQCGKKFRSPSNLYNHMRSHIRDRRYKCNICGKGFLFRNSIKEHIRGVHNHERRVRKRATKRPQSYDSEPYSQPGMNEEMRGLGVGEMLGLEPGMGVGEGKQLTELN